LTKSRRAAFLFLAYAPFLLVAAGFSTAQAQTPPKKPTAGPPAPQSTHYPILLLAFSSDDPPWSLRIGQKGPERLDRPAYPPITLEPSDVTRDGAADSWTYHAKDTGTAAALSVHLTREACTDSVSGTKYAFRAAVEHAQLGTLNGCAKIAAELFPKIINPANQPSDEDDSDKKKPPAEIIPNFKPPAALAYLNSAGKIVVSVSATKKIAAPEGSELALSHDGKKLLYTRTDSKTSPDRTIVLYDFNTGLSHDLVHGLVRRAFWSPDDTRIAFLKSQDQKWQIWTFPAAAPESAAPFYTNDVAALHGWLDAHTILASDMQNLYWISDDSRPIQSLALKDLYGPAFQVMSSDAVRVNPANSDLLLVSADYQTPPKGAPKDSMDLAAGFFLYEVKSKRRVALSPPDQWARGGEWSSDGVQIFYTRRLAANSLSTFRIFWDATGAAPGQRRFMDGTDLVVGQ
jgi:uncharacterized membrane protein